MNAAQFLTFLFFLFRSYDRCENSRVSRQYGAGAGRRAPRLGSDGRARGIPEKPDSRELAP